MKKIITTVGTSLVTNLKSDKPTLCNNLLSLEGKTSNDFDFNKDKVVHLKKTLLDALIEKDDFSFFKASAEIESLFKIKEKYGDGLEVYLIASDSILSPLCAEILKEVLQKKEFTINFNRNLDIIKGLLVNNRATFIRDGLSNLINRISVISNDYFDNIIFNITGGYKGVIPYLTIISMINSAGLCYIYEKSSELIEIPSLPIKINFDIFKKYSEYIEILKNGIKNYHREKNSNYQIWEEIENNGLVETADTIAILSPVGNIFYQKYKNLIFSFYAPDDIWADIESSKIFLNTIKNRFSNNNLRKHQSEEKNKHICFGEGRGDVRVFYFEESGNIYIYKIYPEHNDDYEDLIRTTLNKVKIKSISKKREVQIGG
jgi:putative CRISPR-associated protein (TIGR02619 family)